MNIKRKHLMLIAVVALIALAGCAEQGSSQQEASEDISNTTGDDVSEVEVGGSYGYEVRATEKNQLNLVKTQPPFQMDSSLERANLINRYQYLNDRTNTHHVYAMSNDGKVIAYWVAQGKVSSVNSKLTNDAQIVASEACLETTYHEGEGGCFETVESPQMDGSYGSNGDAIFFFTTSGAYVEWNGKYVVSEEPMNIQTAVSLEQQVDEDGDDASGNSTDG